MRAKRFASFLLILIHAGAVLLPCAGYRSGEAVTLIWDDYPVGNYWTSTTGDYGFLKYWAENLEMDKSNEEECYNVRIVPASRSLGYSVRLIAPGSANQ